MPRPLSPRKRQEIIDRRDSGMTTMEIAVKAKVSRTTVYRVLAAVDHPRSDRQPGASQETIDLIRALYEDGVLLREMAAKVGLSTTTINRYVQAHDMQRPAREDVGCALPPGRWTYCPKRRTQVYAEGVA